MTTFASPTIPNLLQSRANAISSIPFSQTVTFTDVGSPPLAVPRSMVDVSPATSSPSLYSRRGHSPRTHMQGAASRRFRMLTESELELSDGEGEADESHGEDITGRDEEQAEEETDPRKRMSMVGGPKVRKYIDSNPWDDEWTSISASTTASVSTARNDESFSSFGFSRHANKMIAAASAAASAASAGSGRNRPRSRSRVAAAGRERETSTASASASSFVSDISFESTSASTSSTSTRRGLAQLLGKSVSGTARHFGPSASALSLASNQTSSTASTTSIDERANPLTPKLRQASGVQTMGMGIELASSPTLSSNTRHGGKTLFGHFIVDDEVKPPRLLPAAVPKPSSTTTGTTYKKPVPTFTDLPTTTTTTTTTTNIKTNTNTSSLGLGLAPTTFAASDRPLLSSGSPGFGLISLEAAQERERQRSNTSHTLSHPAHPHPHPHLRGVSNPTLTPTTTDINPSALDAARRKVENHRALTAYDITTIPIPSDPPPAPIPIRQVLTDTSAPSSPPNRVRTKKSGLMKLFYKSSDQSQLHHHNQNQSHSHSQVSGATTPKSTREDRGSKTGSMWSEASAEGLWKQSKGRKSSAKGDRPAQPLLTQGHSQPLIKPQLELRPVSMTFARGLPVDYLSQQAGKESPPPPSPNTVLRKRADVPCADISLSTGKREADDDLLAYVLKEQMSNARKAWRVQLFELEAQIRELRDELEQAKSRKGVGADGRECCSTCGCACGGTISNGQLGADESRRKVIDRARVKTAGARGVFGSGSLYEWE